MAGLEFHQTVMGSRFIEGTMPSIARSLEKIADAMGEASKEKPAADTVEVPKWKADLVDAILEESPYDIDGGCSIEQQCGTVWVDTNGKSYSISIMECEE
jgi:hypothetical protein